jgi:cobyrinic acid a,c-diamide synthase
MVLGEALIDGAGAAHAMAGLLPVTTSFATPRRRLGYRQIHALGGPWAGQNFRGHEFHFAEEVSVPAADPLFECADADGNPLGLAGAVRGSVAGSYMHLIDRA